MMLSLVNKIKKWVRSHIIDDVPPDLGDLFDGKKVKNISKHIRFRKHKSYVESRVLEIRSMITIQAIENGCVDSELRELFVKYNNYLKKL